MKKKSVKDITKIRYEENPYLNELRITKKSKKVTISSLGNEGDLVMIDQETGEVKGTHVTTYKSVDDDVFIKLFTQNIALTFGLSSPGIKAFSVLIYAVQHTAIQKDLVALDRFVLNGFLKSHDLKLSLATFSRGLTELVKCQIIARHSRQGFFFINPSFIFNGDRVAFTTLIERKKRSR